jgi:hypothetical protein
MVAAVEVVAILTILPVANLLCTIGKFFDQEMLMALWKRKSGIFLHGGRPVGRSPLFINGFQIKE